MPGRQFNSNAYRYGFNGKENDNEVKGITGSQQEYGMRIYDPRLGRFLSIDPLTQEFPWYTPYQFAGNTPIQASDLDGKEPNYIINEYGHITQPLIRLINIVYGYDAQTINEVSVTKVYNADKEHHGETWSATDVRTNPNSSNTPNQWIKTITHELGHVDQYKRLPFPAWLSRMFYNLDVDKVGYMASVQEIEAREVGDVFENLANRYDIAGILANEKTSYSYKTLKMEEIGYTYQVETLQNSIKENLESAAKLDKEGKTEEAGGYKTEAQKLGISLKQAQEELGRTKAKISNEEKKDGSQ